MRKLRTVRLLAATVVALLLVLAPGSVGAQPVPEQQEEFVPIDELPPEDRLPAAPLLIGAYSFVWLAVLGYVVSVARRLGAVQKEIERLDADVKRSSRG